MLSISDENGIGVSSDAILFTGASKNSNASSEIVDAISAPIPPVILASCNTSARLVFCIDARTVYLSHGNRVLRSILSIETPNLFTNSTAQWTAFP